MVDIINIRVVKGSLPNKQLRLILAWCTIHQDELMQNWELAKDKKTVKFYKSVSLGGVNMQEYFPTVVQVIPQRNYHVQVFFDDGKIVDYDVTDDLQSEVFEQLKNIDTFMNKCTVMNDTLAWDLSGDRDTTKCIDIDPFTLYELKAINDLIA